MVLIQALTSFLMRLDFLCASFLLVVLFAISIELRSRRENHLMYYKQINKQVSSLNRRGEISKNSL